MANRDLLKEAIADAKSVKEAAIANAKAALEEAFTPYLKEKFTAKLAEMEKEDFDGIDEAEEEVEENYSEEKMEVQDDFELLCWDFVSTPSNPGSYMHLVREGKEYNTVNHYTKASGILTEILCAKGTCPII